MTAGYSIPDLTRRRVRKLWHPCPTVWLALMIISNVLVMLVYLLAGGELTTGTGLPRWVIPVGIVECAASILFIAVLFQWRKWGLYGFVGISTVTVAGNFAAGLALCVVRNGQADDPAHLSPAHNWMVLEIIRCDLGATIVDSRTEVGISPTEGWGSYPRRPGAHTMVPRYCPSHDIASVQVLGRSAPVLGGHR